MEKEGLLKRTHGGAINARVTDLELQFNVRANWHKDEKKRIGAAAAGLVKEGDTIILDAGSTNMEIARNLKRIENLTIVTNALNIAMELGGYPGINIILIGGTFKKSTISLVGSQAERSINEINVDKAFIGVNGISLREGLTNTSILEIGIKRAMINAAKEVIVAADSSKFGRVAFVSLAQLTAADKIVTDNKVSLKDIEALRDKGVEVIVV